ncbi:zf-HC2 domain-containing protein [Anaerolineales bacterium HSG25]|nr:zf-HC2 domain-containing protein [Anaerolineales bacterium HSG25]
MPIKKHVTEFAEAYLNNQLSLQERQQVDEHLSTCLACTRYFFSMRRVRREIEPVMKQALGNPVPPAQLQHQIRRELAQSKSGWFHNFFWHFPKQTLSHAGTLAVTAFLVISLVILLQNVNNSEPAIVVVTATPFLQLQTVARTSGKNAVLMSNDAPSAKLSQKHSTLPETNQLEPNLALQEAIPLARSAATKLGVVIPAPSLASHAEPDMPTLLKRLTYQPDQPKSAPKEAVIPAKLEIPSPTGIVAFAVFDPTQGEYRIQLLNLDENSISQFPVSGVSEPTLRRDGIEYRLTYRAWGNPTRALLSSGLDGELHDQVTYFWEDAQPDWSPREERIIFASQRETDRKWRLYTAWGDGSMEYNLRREGKSPTFAPDGYRFAFESCDQQDEHASCGLWLADLEHSEYDAKPFLVDTQAKAPDWSPHGETIAYMGKQADDWNIYLTDSQGSYRDQLTTDPASDGAPTWSPDGEWLAFFSHRGNSWGVWVLHVQSKQIQQVYDFGLLTIAHPDNEAEWWHEQLSWSD